MVVAHHELVRRKRIERVLELLGLADREVPGVEHLVILALEQSLARALGEETERLGEHTLERCRQQRVEHADRGGRRVFLDAQHRAESRTRGRSILDRLASEDRSGGRKSLVERCSRQRHRLPLRVH